MRDLLDTSVFSQPLRAIPNPRMMARWSDHNVEELATSAVVIAEVLSGIEQLGSAMLRRPFNSILRPFYQALPFDDAVAATYAALQGELKRLGRPRPILDLMIAATARHHGLIVATLNEKDFLGIPGVAVENWA